MSDTPAFPGLVPGFEFLQDLVRNAGAALPGIGQWVAPTLDPEEIDKRIGELRTVQFWLEQNARMLAATIQALEVQRMTLSTLKTMNVQMGDLRDSMQIRMPASPPPSVSPTAPAPAPAPAAEPAPAPDTTARGEAAPAAGVVDPLQWWGALTRQFTDLATQALKDTGADAGRKLAAARVRTAFEPGAAGPAPAPAAAAAKKRKPAAKRAAAKKSPARA